MEAPLLTLPNDNDRSASYNYGASMKDDETTLIHRKSDNWESQDEEKDNFVNVEVYNRSMHPSVL